MITEAWWDSSKKWRAAMDGYKILKEKLGK